ncbi:hypothetical protein AAFF_G00324280 [Aldrovandia affinis]|uniref:C2H2-type domain-containing protein n=1 Tax=Aldrovandia affinis TaxID=143900 RepID=A0AAD7R938_9TELE|nr:hypothetical protein AAFF_G00324280 [Aldrovandia affinis]
MRSLGSKGQVVTRKRRMISELGRSLKASSMNESCAEASCSSPVITPRNPNTGHLVDVSSPVFACSQCPFVHMEEVKLHQHIERVHTEEYSRNGTNLILKRKTVPKEAMPAGIIVRAQAKGWMETELVVDWLKVVWGRRRGGLRKRRNMLVLDAFRGHLTEPVKKQVKAMNGDLVIIPGGMTSQLQVLDVVVNKPFKDHLRKRYTEWLLAGNHALTPSGKIQKPAVRRLCEWILQAWADVSPESIVNGFKKCCISNAMDGSEDDVMWEEAEPGGCPTRECE